MSCSWQKSRAPLCHGYRLQEHFKKDCPRAKHPDHSKMENEVAGEEKEAANEIGVTSSTMEAGLVAAIHENIYPLQRAVEVEFHRMRSEGEVRPRKEMRRQL